jgi:hypothetical protein
MIVIEFLYNQYSDRIKTILFPPFMLHIILVLTVLTTTETYRSYYNAKGEIISADELYNETGQIPEDFDEDQFKKNAERAHLLNNIAKIICTILNLVNLLTFI